MLFILCHGCSKTVLIKDNFTALLLSVKFHNVPKPPLVLTFVRTRDERVLYALGGVTNTAYHRMFTMSCVRYHNVPKLYKYCLPALQVIIL